MHSLTVIALQPGRAAKARRAVQDLTQNLSARFRRWRHARHVDATASALGLLDDRVLRDIGLDRSELRSAAAELHRRAHRDRLHAVSGMR
jgi:uncharacterized protein YjiS (DUF1127 family)